MEIIFHTIYAFFWTLIIIYANFSNLWWLISTFTNKTRITNGTHETLIYWKSWIYLKLVGRSNIRAIVFILVFVSFLFLFLEYICQWVTLSYTQTDIINSLSWPWRRTHRNNRKTIHTKLYTVVSGKLEMYALTWEYNHMSYM